MNSGWKLAGFFGFSAIGLALAICVALFTGDRESQQTATSSAPAYEVSVELSTPSSAPLATTSAVNVAAATAFIETSSPAKAASLVEPTADVVAPSVARQPTLTVSIEAVASADAADDAEAETSEESANQTASDTVAVSESEDDGNKTETEPAEPILVAPAPAFTQQPILDQVDPAVMDNINKILKSQKAQAKALEDADIKLPTAKVIKAAQPLESTPPAPSDAEILAPPPAKLIEKDGDNKLSLHFQDQDIRKVLDAISLQGNLNILASSNVQGTVTVALDNVDIHTALEAILKSAGLVARREGKFIYVGNSADFLSMEQSVDKIGTRIYRPNYIKASDLQALVTPLLTPGAGTISVSAPSQVGIAPDTNAAGGDQFAGSDAVLVRDFEAVLTQIDQVFEELDKRPLQVAIESMILSVNLGDKTSLGVDFQLLRDNNHIKLATGSPLSDLGQVSFKDGGLKFGFLDSSLGAFINALETIGDTNVIATPRLMCLNKHRAEVLIGQQLGYVNTTLTETSTSQSVQFLEVGTQLRMRPFVSSDGMIRMEVHPELSTGVVKIDQGFTLPEKDLTQVTTNIMVPDGRTVIIGGLLRDELIKNTTQVPVLGSAPGIGFLFRSKKEETNRRELIVLITPHIVYEPQAGNEGDTAACEFHRRHAVYSDHMSPLGTRNIGRKYFRLAQNAWANQNKKTALRFINLSIHFDPTNRAAIDLRSDIMAGNHLGAHSGPQGAVLTPDALDGPGVGEWVGEVGDGVGPQANVHPIDPGNTGRVRNIDKPGKLR